MRHRICVGTPEQNGFSKQMNMMLYDRVRIMLLQVSVSKDFWAHVINIACYLTSILSSMDIENKTPFEEWFGSPANYKHIRVFG